MSVSKYYELVAALEQAPVTAAAEQKAASEAHRLKLAELREGRARAEREAQEKQKQLGLTHKRCLEEAASRGVRAASVDRGTDRAPDFDGARRLAKTIDQHATERDLKKRALENARADLQRLEQLIAEESRRGRMWAQARAIDAVRLVAGVVLVTAVAVPFGPTIPGVFLVGVAAGLTLLSFKLGPSALLMNRAGKEHGLPGSSSRDLGGFVTVACALVALVGLGIGAVTGGLIVPDEMHGVGKTWWVGVFAAVCWLGRGISREPNRGERSA